MGSHQCLRCRSAIRQTTYIRRTLPTCRIQCYSSSPSASNESQFSAPPIKQSPSKLDVHALLSKPTWSVKSLLPPSSNSNNNNTSTTPVTTSSPSPTPSSPPPPTITPSKLQHLLRLSALPQPTSPAEEAHLLHTLHTQLHFVRAIQAVDTTGVTPLVTLRDETHQGTKEATIGLQHPRIREALRAERKVGSRGRVRRVVVGSAGGVEADGRSEEERGWDPLLGARGRTVGRYFVVESGKSRGGNGGGGGGSGSDDGSGSAIEVTSGEATRRD